MEEKKVTNVSQFTDALYNLSGEGFSFFRGQGSYKRYKLLPSLLRKNIQGNRYYSNECDTSFLNIFKTRAIPYINNAPRDDWEWLLTAQHYGVPTRLLDWTQSPLVALFFAVDDNPEINDDDDPVVWCLNPNTLNSKSPFNGEIPNLMERSESLLHKWLDEYYALGKFLEEVKYPIALVGPRSNDRVNAQKGVFTLFPLNAQPLEEMNESEEFLYKIIIDNNKKGEVKKQLFELGITYSNIYPELESISKDIVFEYSI
ncbi:MAG: FRG domain-containing protein [Bacillaceae bacterium]|nr:FRG domain-containing protein [Bacillaceae bacterium]